MRRFKQQLPDAEAKKILMRAADGVLSLVGADGKPYGVPMSYVYDGENSVYFHCALSGRKIDCIRSNSYVCFTVIAQDEIHPEEFTTYFKSVVTEGQISVLTDKQEKIAALRILSAKYSPGLDCEPEIKKDIDKVAILKMEINSLSGKEAIELTRKRMSHNTTNVKQ